MSSHHIVRDQQEPALWIVKKEGIHWPLIEELLEWSPTLMVSEDALDGVLSQGIKIDIVATENAEPAALKNTLLDQWPIECIQGNGSDLSIGLDYFYQKNYATLSIIANPQDFGNIQAYLSKIELIFYYKAYKIIWVKSGFWKKWVPKGSLFKISVNFLSMKNLSFISEESAYLSQEDGFVEIDAGNNAFWLYEKILNI